MCEHKRLRCTDGVYYCLDCGAKVDPPKPAEEPKPKRRTRRKDDDNGQNKDAI